MTPSYDPRPSHYDARFAIHLALTAGMAWLAVILALPGDTFGSGRGWTKFAELGPENTWAMVFWAIASVGAVGLTTDRRGTRLLSVLVLSASYSIVAGLMYWGSPAGSGTGIYAALAGQGYYLAWRRTSEAVL